MRKIKSTGILATILLICMIWSIGCQKTNSKETEDIQKTIQGGSEQYSVEQAISENAQLSTVAFSGLAFITGNKGADTFMPPGKVADFFGFQYMRDVDTAGYGHNTQFLTRAANNILFILNDEQKKKLVDLAASQASIYTSFAYNRFPLMDAFRQSLEGRDGLDVTVVAEYTSRLYEYDAKLSYERGVVLGEIIQSLTAEQKDYLAKMEFNNFNTWPEVAEDTELKEGMTNTEFTAVMTYASEFFSWYKGSLEADVYFCPERHGTYFGGFFMKDYPAMNNPDYFISTEVTGDKGKKFLNILNSNQRTMIENTIVEQKDMMQEIVEIRTEVATELRKAQVGKTIDKEKVYALIKRYGYLDGIVSGNYAKVFSEINATLTAEQRASLIALRDLDVVPQGAYMFSKDIPMPLIPDTSFMFGEGSIPENAGAFPVPSGFETEQKNDNGKPVKKAPQK